MANQVDNNDAQLRNVLNLAPGIGLGRDLPLNPEQREAAIIRMERRLERQAQNPQAAALQAQIAARVDNRLQAFQAFQAQGGINLLNNNPDEQEQNARARMNRHELARIEHEALLARQNQLAEQEALARGIAAERVHNEQLARQEFINNNPNVQDNVAAEQNALQRAALGQEARQKYLKYKAKYLALKKML